MLKSILQVPQDVLDSIDFVYKPRAHELKHMCIILQPFEEATNASQSENIVTSSEVIICIRSLREQLLNMTKNYNCRLLTTLQDSLQKRLSKYEEMEAFQLTASLDPRYKLDWCTDAEFENVKEILLKKLEEMTPVIPCTQPEEAPPPAKRSRPGLSFMKNRASCSGENETSIFEITKYLAQSCIPDDTDVLKYWKDNKETYPMLTKLAMIYLALPASSAAVERIFSISGKIFRPERCRLSDTLFQNLMFIRCNLTK